MSSINLQEHKLEYVNMNDDLKCNTHNFLKKCLSSFI